MRIEKWSLERKNKVFEVLWVGSRAIKLFREGLYSLLGLVVYIDV